MKFDDQKIDFSKIGIETKPEKKAQFIVIYGRPCTGKTTMACYAPDPVLIPIGRETGHERMHIPKFTNPGMEPYDFVIASIMKLLKTEHSRKTAIFDNIGTYREVIDEMIMEKNPTAKSGDKVIQVTSLADYGFGKGASMAYPYWNRLLEGFSKLLEKDINVILIGHDLAYNINLENGDYYQKIGINAPSGEKTNVRSLIEERAHYVLYVKKIDRTISKKGKFGGVDTVPTNANASRIVYTTETGMHFAKSRLALPDTYEIDHSDNEEELLKTRSNESIKQLFEDLLK